MRTLPVIIKEQYFLKAQINKKIKVIIYCYFTYNSFYLFSMYLFTINNAKTKI